jgi:hypothetical protein
MRVSPWCPATGRIITQGAPIPAANRQHSIPNLQERPASHARHPHAASLPPSEVRKSYPFRPEDQSKNGHIGALRAPPHNARSEMRHALKAMYQAIDVKTETLSGAGKLKGTNTLHGSPTKKSFPVTSLIVPLLETLTNPSCPQLGAIMSQGRVSQCFRQSTNSNQSGSLMGGIPLMFANRPP